MSRTHSEQRGGRKFRVSASIALEVLRDHLHSFDLTAITLHIDSRRAFFLSPSLLCTVQSSQMAAVPLGSPAGFFSPSARDGQQQRQQQKKQRQQQQQDQQEQDDQQEVDSEDEESFFETGVEKPIGKTHVYHLRPGSANAGEEPLFPQSFHALPLLLAILLLIGSALLASKVRRAPPRVPEPYAPSPATTPLPFFPPEPAFDIIRPSWDKEGAERKRRELLNRLNASYDKLLECWKEAPPIVRTTFARRYMPKMVFDRGPAPLHPLDMFAYHYERVKDFSSTVEGATAEERRALYLRIQLVISVLDAAAERLTGLTVLKNFSEEKGIRCFLLDIPGADDPHAFSGSTWDTCSYEEFVNMMVGAFTEVPFKDIAKPTRVPTPLAYFAANILTADSTIAIMDKRVTKLFEPFLTALATPTETFEGRPPPEGPPQSEKDLAAVSEGTDDKGAPATSNDGGPVFGSKGAFVTGSEEALSYVTLTSELLEHPPLPMYPSERSFKVSVLLRALNGMRDYFGPSVFYTRVRFLAANWKRKSVAAALSTWIDEAKTAVQKPAQKRDRLLEDSYMGYQEPLPRDKDLLALCLHLLF